tara:strand:+ start:81 stop:617 length:537 start_codon:yes stop_codon:yes gene_type:complete
MENSNVHFINTLPTLSEEEKVAAKKELLRHTPETINKFMKNTPNVIDGCSLDGMMLKCDNLKSAHNLYRELLKFNIKLDVIKSEENLKRWWCAFNNPRDHTKYEMDQRLILVMDELSDMPIDIARAITLESKKKWLYKPTTFQINELFSQERKLREHFLTTTKKFIDRFSNEEQSDDN